jgi:hypothetical protein
MEANSIKGAEAAIVFHMPIALTVCALGNFSFVPGWFKFNFTLVKVFNIEDSLIAGPSTLFNLLILNLSI